MMMIMQVKKGQLILVLLAILFSSIAIAMTIAETCEVQKIQSTLVKSLYSYLTEPNSGLPFSSCT